jgi:hypothetical protein
MKLRQKQKAGDAVGRPSGRSSLLRDPGAKFFLEKLGRGRKQEKRALGYRPPRGLEPSLPVALRGGRGAVA